MNIVLWILQILLALAFLAAGGTKLTQPRDKLTTMLPWTEDFTLAQVKGIGALELAGAVGLVLPAVTGIAPLLVPIAATGLALMMAGAVVVHLRRGDPVAAWMGPLVLGVLAVVVAWGRFGPYPL